MKQFPVSGRRCIVLGRSSIEATSIRVDTSYYVWATDNTGVIYIEASTRALNITQCGSDSRAVVRCKYQRGALVSRAPNTPKYKPRSIGKIKLEFTDQTSITECIEFYRLTFVPGGPSGPYGHVGTATRGFLAKLRCVCRKGLLGYYQEFL